MPIYEFICRDCATVFEDLVLSASRMDEVICPKCGSSDVRKKMSTFASKAASDGGSSIPLSSASHSCAGST